MTCPYVRAQIKKIRLRRLVHQRRAEDFARYFKAQLYAKIGDFHSGVYEGITRYAQGRDWKLWTII
jgi:hypothetical protein